MTQIILLILSLLALMALSLITQKLYLLYFKSTPKITQWGKEINLLLQKGQVPQALDYLQSHPTFLSRGVAEAIRLTQKSAPFSEVFKALDQDLLPQVKKWEQRIETLAGLGNLIMAVTFIGSGFQLLLGPHFLSSSTRGESLRIIMEGLSLILPLGFGLSVLCMLSYSIFQNQANRLIADGQDGTLQIVKGLDSIKGRHQQSS